MPGPSRAVRAGRLMLLLAVFGLVGMRLVDLAIGYTTPTLGCRVTGVIDGDTVRLACPDGDATRGRLVGFDTPEIFSPRCAGELSAGLRATARLRLEIWGASEIETRGTGHDRYGRRLVRLYLDGEDVAKRMIASRLARPYDGGKRGDWCQ